MQNAVETFVTRDFVPAIQPSEDFAVHQHATAMHKGMWTVMVNPTSLTEWRELVIQWVQNSRLLTQEQRDAIVQDPSRLEQIEAIIESDPSLHLPDGSWADSGELRMLEKDSDYRAPFMVSAPPKCDSQIGARQEMEVSMKVKVGENTHHKIGTSPHSWEDAMLKCLKKALEHLPSMKNLTLFQSDQSSVPTANGQNSRVVLTFVLGDVQATFSSQDANAQLAAWNAVRDGVTYFALLLQSQPDTPSQDSQ